MKPVTVELYSEEYSYYIEVDSTSSNLDVKYTDIFTKYKITYTCPNCLSRQTRSLVGLSDELSIFCSECNSSHQIYDNKEKELSIISTEVESLLRGLKQLHKKAHMKSTVLQSSISKYRWIWIYVQLSILTNGQRIYLPTIIFVEGILVALVGMFSVNILIALMSFGAVFLVLTLLFNPKQLANARYNFVSSLSSRLSIECSENVPEELFDWPTVKNIIHWIG